MKLWKRLIPLALALTLLAGCATTGDITDEDVYLDRVELQEVSIEDEAVAMSDAPAALSTMLLPEASGTKVEKNSRATIDYSNIKDGYVMVKCSSTGKKLMVQVFGPSYATNETKYTYNLNGGEWTTFPLSDGNGSYKVTVYENTSGKSYAALLSASFNVTMEDEFAPFLRPNQYVDYANAPKAVAKAAELAGSETDALKLVEIVYDYVVKNLTYDKKLATTVKSGYLPVLDDVLAKKTGICFDYASLMTGMLRSLGVPCKLVVGYAGTSYHAWINVWSEETGWVNGAVYFDGVAWQRMDPTFASSGNQSAAIMKYIGNGKNYNPMYLY
ncbi:MAG: transglutaminase domain-containing protein [Clostridiales bacterium]|nr:transglutaminase domain-containing protein [Clostridiales bacterium]